MQTNDDLINDFKYEEETSKTYKLNILDKNITGEVDKIEALKQAIFLILNTERYENLIYSYSFGIEINDLYGKELNYVISKMKTRIKEALLQDTRITNVANFDFTKNKSKLLITFTVISVFGDIESEKVVNI